MAVLTREPIDLTALQRTGAAEGALCLFVGVVRDHHQGRRVLRLEYEAYEEMALPLLARIEEEARRRWPVGAVSIVHRLGPLEVGEASVAVAVRSAHREEAFAACRWAIDTLKATVPIWKKEYGEDGSSWMEGPGTCAPDTAALEPPPR
ncbi:MAG TPA: molybdenum cofactor biosynthesis protein MoaE [Vicinamibacteria bacterium]|nr:molybdenum cofactor biosynthesis protein MoaE [Vicinamibacteria bacterium]